MPVLSVQNLTKYYGSDLILADLSFSVEDGQRVAVIGKNGAGKTTLLKLLFGTLAPDSGSISVASGKSMGMADQIPSYPPDFTALDVLKTGFSSLDRLADQLRELETALEQASDPALVRQHGETAARFETLGGYETDTRLKKISTGLGLPDEMLMKSFAVLSGGEKTRVNLARIILEAPDILFLDEPTNHLDMVSCAWLETFIKAYPGTVLMVSHDRYFLDQAAGLILEIEDAKIEAYNGNYSYYTVEKERRTEERLRLYDKQQAEISRLQATADRLHSWGTQSVKMHRRAFSIEKRIEKITPIDRPRKARSMEALFTARKTHTEDMIRIKSLGKRYGAQTILTDFNLTVRNGDRLGIIGQNGSGKTTLIRLLLGLETPDSGSIFIAPSAKPAYLPQSVQFQDESRSLVDTLLYEKNLSTAGARNRLGTFGFSGEDQFKQVASLSGGEKSRLYLCMLMSDPVNLLILDEPTNHLDIPSREWIESAIEAFDGTLLFISHDRYFLDRFATRILAFTGAGADEYPYGFSEYLARKEQAPNMFAASSAGKEKPLKNTPPRDGKKKKRLLSVLERDIDKISDLLNANENTMAEAAADAEKLLALMADSERLRQEQDALYEQWQALADETT